MWVHCLQVRANVLTILNLKAGVDGAKTFRAFVDAAGLTIEVSETNNQAVLAYNVITKPDVRVTGITLMPAIPSRGGVFDAKVTVKNEGSAPATNVLVSVWVDMAAVATNNAGRDQETTVTIATNASIVHTFYWSDCGDWNGAEDIQGVCGQ